MTSSVILRPYQLVKALRELADQWIAGEHGRMPLLVQEAADALEAAGKAAEELRARTLYKELCKHPARCANLGRCGADWCCND